MPSNWLVFDRIRALTRQFNIFQAERVFQNQSNLDRLVAGGEFLDFNTQAAILDQTNLQINRLERYKDYEQMDQTGEISLALDLYADEACVTGDTRIPLLDGSCPTIAELASRGIDHEFWVYSYDVKKAKYIPAKAKGARISGMNVKIVRVVLDDDLTIRCTDDHLFLLNNDEFTRAKDLNPGDSLKPYRGKNHKVVSVEECGIVDKVYDIEVPNYHCFAAGTDDSWVIIHNSLVDPERKHTLIIRAKNRRLKKELEEFFFSTLLWDTYCRPSVRYLCKYGDLPFEVIPTFDRSAVASLKFMNVYNFTRIETRFGDLVGFFYQDAFYPQPQFLHPWQVMHLRLTSFENIYHPYGRAVVDGGRKAFKQLRLMEDAALIYRITRAPEKRKFIIPVGIIPPKEVPEYMQMVARNFKRQRFYNPTTGTFDERYSPLIQEDDFLLPRRPDGSGPDIETLPGAENLDQIADIEYFKKKMIAPTKIPFARVGIGEGAGEPSEKSLSQSHSEFAKAVQWVQREVSTGLTKVAIIHLALRGYSIEDIKGFDIALTATSAMEELYRIETWQTRVGVMADLKDLGWFPREWIVTHFTDLSPDEIQELKEMEDTETTPAEGAGGPGGGGAGPLGAGGPLDMAGEEEVAAVPPEGEEEEAPVEGFDYAAEKRLLLEFKKQGRRKEAMKLVERWATRLGKPVIKEDIELSSGFDHFLAQNELDGLSANPSESSGLNIHDPNNDHDLIIEWSVNKTERDSAINETYNVLTGSVEQSGGSEITEDDLPVRVSML